jgi:hypothetical protein
MAESDPKRPRTSMVWLCAPSRRACLACSRWMRLVDVDVIDWPICVDGRPILPCRRCSQQTQAAQGDIVKEIFYGTDLPSPTALKASKITVVGVGQVGMACAFSILSQVRDTTALWCCCCSQVFFAAPAQSTGMARLHLSHKTAPSILSPTFCC